MRYIFTIAINDIRVYIQDTGNLFNLFVVPVILALVLGFAFGGGSQLQYIRVDVVDLDNTAASTQLLTELRQVNPALVLCPFDTVEDFSCNLNADDPTFTVSDALTRVEDDQTAALIVIPAGYEQSLLNIEPIQIEYYSQEISQTDVVLQALQTAIQPVNGEVIATWVSIGVAQALNAIQDESILTSTAYDIARSKWAVDNIQVVYQTASGTSGITGNGFNQSVPGMATMYVLITAFGGMIVLLQERKQWTFQRLVVLPVSRAHLLGGKILARFLLGLITFTVLIIVGVFTGVSFGNDPLAIALIILSYTLCVTALSFAFAPLLRSEEQASSVSLLLSLSLAALGGAWWPLEIVPDFMRVISNISPVAWAMNGFSEVLFYNGGVADVMVYVATMLIASLVFFIIGIMTFKYE
ncbi:MAG: ABC transporter permease [Phototrophicales bacterium]